MPGTDFDALPVISIAALEQGSSDAIDGVTSQIVAA